MFTRNHSSAEWKQAQSNSGVGAPKVLATLLLAGAFNSTAGFHMAAGRYNVNNPSVRNMGVPRSVRFATTSFLNPQQALMARRAFMTSHNAGPGMLRRTVRHAGPLMALTTPMEGGGDDDFENALSRLAPSKELPELRKRVRELDSLILKAIKDEDFEAAARCRDEINELRLRDPVPFSSLLRSRMQAATEDNDFEEAAKCRDQLRQLKGFLPEYNLVGRWKGNFPEQGDVFVNIRYDGDILIAERLGGHTSFTADVSESNDGLRGMSLKDFVSNIGDRLPDGASHFEGKGRLAVGAFVPGQLYLLDDESIGFLFLGGKDDEGGERVLATAGRAEPARDGFGGFGGGRGGGGVGGEAFVVFKKVEDYWGAYGAATTKPTSIADDYETPPEITSTAASLNKLFKLDSNPDDTPENEQK